MKITAIDIYLAKEALQNHRDDTYGKEVLRKQVKRKDVVVDRLKKRHVPKKTGLSPENAGAIPENWFCPECQVGQYSPWTLVQSE